MGNQNLKAIEVMSGAMQTMVDKKLDGVARDRTRAGMIQNVNGDGTFGVVVDGKVYNNVPCYGYSDMTSNDIVKVVYPDNNPTNMYILPPYNLATIDKGGLISYNDYIKLQSLSADDDSGASYTHEQMSASAHWIINHTLNRYPAVTIVDTGGSTVEGDVVYINANRIEIYFSAPFSGNAYLT